MISHSGGPVEQFDMHIHVNQPSGLTIMDSQERVATM
jgi:hypothetical protein